MHPIPAVPHFCSDICVNLTNVYCVHKIVFSKMNIAGSSAMLQNGAHLHNLSFLFRYLPLLLTASSV